MATFSFINTQNSQFCKQKMCNCLVDIGTDTSGNYDDMAKTFDISSLVLLQ